MFIETRSRSVRSRETSLQRYTSTALALRLVPLSAKNRNCDAMKETPQSRAPVKRRPTWKLLAVAAAILAVIQACLTIEGRGIEGFILWVIILFVGYLLFFTLVIWLVQRFRNRA